MKKSLYFMAALLVAMVGCNKEPQQTSTSGTEDGKVYMQFSVNMLTTRSGTDSTEDDKYGSSDANPDTEVGLAKENTISTVDLVLTNDEEYIITSIKTNDIEAATGVANTYIASFQSEDLTAGATYSVYVYANSSAPTTKDLDATSKVAVSDMTKDDLFWMTNAYEATTVTLPDDLSAHTQPNTPFNLGAHYVERSMARFDYMPINNNVYSIMKDDAVHATITLTDAALINHSNEFYLLRRVSADGTSSNWKVGGVELPTNCVVDVDYTAKANGYTAALVANFEDHLTVPTEWDWKSIAVKEGGLSQVDNWDGINDGTDDPLSGEDADGNPIEEDTPEHTLNQYYIWQYAKENTIPGVDNQDHGISTGIVFRGTITGDAIPTKPVDGTYPQVYVFESTLYGVWDDVVNAVKAENAPATLVSAYNKVAAGLAALAEGATPAEKAKVYADAGFTGYSADSEGNYTVYYYYWNRHNDNGDNSEMGVMEFAVVRNNVYKLCVDKIAKFGHPDPTKSENPDPDPVNPDDPDEDLNYYFNVTVKVLPWVVRVNHIEF